MLPAFLYAVAVSLVLGACVPVTIAYVVGAVVAAAPLVAAGVPQLPVHLLIVLCALIASGLPLPTRSPRARVPVPR